MTNSCSQRSRFLPFAEVDGTPRGSGGVVVGSEVNDMAKPSCWFGRMCRTARKGTVEQAHQARE
jgi:hypothetical protein